ncbi:MAG: phage/plasmid primase, P4 family [Syntrophales bacterium]|jgi:putative DNA primase/helicase|nr:phage/plasmid primase, P4 family [Syntrophales bacterium]
MDLQNEDAITEKRSHEADARSIEELVKERVRNEQASQEKPEKSPITPASIEQCLFRNELGDGELYAELHRGRHIYNVNEKEYFTWDGHNWKRDILGNALNGVEAVSEEYLLLASHLEAKLKKVIKGEEPGNEESLQNKIDAAYKRVKKLRSLKGRNACLEFASTGVDSLAVDGAKFDSDPWLLGCENGVTDLQTGVFGNGRAEDMITKHSPVVFKGLDEPAPLWEKTLLEIFNDDKDLVSFIQRLLGYCITGSTKAQVFAVFYGVGRNGKTLIVDTLMHVMGPLAAPIPSEMLLDQTRRASGGPSPDIMALKGLRLAVASESDEGRRFSPSRVKWLTGRDELAGRNPHDKRFTYFKPTHKLILLTNDKPQAPAMDFAFWERVILVPFTQSFVDRELRESHEHRADPDLFEKLKREAAGILAWLVWGCLEWQARGLDPPRSVTEATSEYRRDEDLIGDFVEECCIIEPGATGRAGDLFERFEEWYLSNVGKKVPSQHWLGKQLRKRFEKVRHNGRVVYKGVDVIPR